MNCETKGCSNPGTFLITWRSTSGETAHRLCDNCVESSNAELAGRGCVEHTHFTVKNSMNSVACSPRSDADENAKQNPEELPPTDMDSTF